ncbi:MAG: YdcF family protein [Acetobacteraceae bacterium]|nr:YdcF family protein [Acetobacteraceae bacterium]
MSLQSVLTTLLLPPILLVLLCLVAGALGRRLLVVAGALLLLALATPIVSGWLLVSLERAVPRGPFAAPPGCEAGPGAIVILSGDIARGQDGTDVGPLTLERLRAGAALHRRTGLPILLSGGAFEPGGTPLAVLMRRSLVHEFDVPVRWLESRSADTAQNAAFSVAMLRAEGICAAWVVTHAWHLPRTLEAFARHPGVTALPAPVRFRRAPPGDEIADYIPRVDRWTDSWFALREWAGRLVYAIRD